MRWLAVAVLVVMAACGGGSDSTATTTAPGPTPLTDDQAARLAQSGFANLQSGGAVFEAHSAFVAGERETVSIYGQVDWANHTGRVLVRADGADAGVTEVYWTKDAVLERRPAMDALVEARGGPAQPWITRPPEPATRQLHRLIALVAALASEQPDNALLIQQTPGSAFVRDDVLRGTPVEVLRYGSRNLHWLSQADGLLVRFDGNSAGGTAPTVIDILERRAGELPAPPRADVVTAESLGELYTAFAGASLKPQPNEVDRWFVAAMVPHHRLGVELLEIAQPRVHDVRVRRLVFAMGDYHHSELHHLERRLQQWGVAEAQRYPGHLAPATLEELRRLAGRPHDVAWLQAMIEHHEGAVAIAQRQVSEGDDADLRRLAATVAEVQRAEIEEMKGLLSVLV